MILIKMPRANPPKHSSKQHTARCDLQQKDMQDINMACPMGNLSESSLIIKTAQSLPSEEPQYSSDDSSSDEDISNKKNSKGNDKKALITTPEEKQKSRLSNSKVYQGIANSHGETITHHVRKSMTQLRQELGLSDNKTWLTWIRGPGFRPFWKAFEEDYLQKKDKTKPGRGVGINEVLNLVKTYEQPDFAHRFPDKSKWQRSHHMAWFMYRIVRYNTKHPDGLFWNRPLALGKAELLLWSVFKAVSRLHAPSQIEKLSGGRALLDPGYVPASKRKAETEIPRSTKRREEDSQKLSTDDSNEVEQADSEESNTKLVQDSWRWECESLRSLR